MTAGGFSAQDADVPDSARTVLRIVPKTQMARMTRLASMDMALAEH